jgi:hypothetical protein
MSIKSTTITLVLLALGIILVNAIPMDEHFKQFCLGVVFLIIPLSLALYIRGRIK